MNMIIVCVCLCMYVCECACVRACAHACICVCVCVCVCVRACVCMHFWGPALCASRRQRTLEGADLLSTCSGAQNKRPDVRISGIHPSKSS